MQKRQQRDDDDDDSQNVGLKRAKFDSNSSALVPIQPTSQAVTVSAKSKAMALLEPSRTSSLASPEMHLLGHESAIYSISFDPSGKHLCSGSLDKKICRH